MDVLRNEEPRKLPGNPVALVALANELGREGTSRKLRLASVSVSVSLSTSKSVSEEVEEDFEADVVSVLGPYWSSASR